ncbi:hypothetical protein FOXYSP1_08380 [Fusarium oxysporum f. sp. phaseoli]
MHRLQISVNARGQRGTIRLKASLV